ncbi:MAG TPA: hypothetical protein VKU91_00630, partial [Acidimicrobiales bacterium]|nr:hypothetical protein [Acidimicrobiales bacterium]
EAAAQRARRVAGARKAEGDTRSRAERRRRGAPTEPEADVTATEPEAGVTPAEAAPAEPTAGEPEGSVTAAEAAPAEPTAGEVAVEAEEQGIVDQQAPALAAEEPAEESKQEESAVDEGNE